MLKLRRRKTSLEQLIAQAERQIEAVEIFDADDLATTGAVTGGALDQLVALLTRKNAAVLLLERINLQINRTVEQGNGLGLEVDQALAEQEAAALALGEADYRLAEGRILDDANLDEGQKQHGLMLLRRRYGR
jgi:hypothetical protein